MNNCVPTACRELKRAHTRAWGDGWRAGYDTAKEDAAKVLQSLLASLRLGNTVAAYDTCERALREVKQ
jgi:hypothetical protein